MTGPARWRPPACSLGAGAGWGVPPRPLIGSCRSMARVCSRLPSEPVSSPIMRRCWQRSEAQLAGQLSRKACARYLLSEGTGMGAGLNPLPGQWKLQVWLQALAGPDHVQLLRQLSPPTLLQRLL